MTRRPTIRSVAERAGVSPTTVSLVLNNQAGSIPEPTRERVWEAVQALGYRPNANARALGGAQSHTIGFVTDIIASSGYAGRSVLGAQDLCWANSKLLMIVNTSDDPALIEAAVAMLSDRRVDGIVYAVMSMHGVEAPEALTGIPTVMMNGYDTTGRFGSVLADEEQGGYAATRTLIEAGHRRIGLLYGTPEVDAGRLRRDGYIRALAEAGLAFDPALVRTASWFPEGGYVSTKALMGLSDRPTSLFCVNDWVAMGCYEALKELGLAIPADVSVVGYDNSELAGLLRPGLTSVQLPHYELGRQAVELLLDPTNPPAAGISLRLPCPVIGRASVAPPPFARTP